jgi:hypothetical protein
MEQAKISSGIYEGYRNRVGIGLSYRPARLHSLAEWVPWNRFLGSLKVQKFGLWFITPSRFWWKTKGNSARACSQ